MTQAFFFLSSDQTNQLGKKNNTQWTDPTVYVWEKNALKTQTKWHRKLQLKGKQRMLKSRGQNIYFHILYKTTTTQKSNELIQSASNFFIIARIDKNQPATSSLHWQPSSNLSSALKDDSYA